MAKKETLNQQEGVAEETQEQEEMSGALKKMAEEMELPSDVDDSTAEHKPGWKQKLRLAMSILSLGATLSASELKASASPEDEAMLTKLKEQRELIDREINKIEAKKSAENRETRKKYLDGLVKEFLNPDLKLGAPEVLMRTPQEQFGVYLKEKHQFDIMAQGMKFEDYEIIGSVAVKMKEAGVPIIGNKFSLEKGINLGDFSIKIDPKASKKIAEWGGKGLNMQKKEFDFGHSEIEFTDDSKEIIVTLEGENVVVKCVNKNGSVERVVAVKGIAQVEDSNQK